MMLQSYPLFQSNVRIFSPFSISVITYFLCDIKVVSCGLPFWLKRASGCAGSVCSQTRARLYTVSARQSLNTTQRISWWKLQDGGDNLCVARRVLFRWDGTLSSPSTYNLVSGICTHNGLSKWMASVHSVQGMYRDHTFQVHIPYTDCVQLFPCSC